MKTFVDSGFVNIGDKISYQDFKEAWYAFLNLLDIDYQRSFECPSCGPDPDTVVMDATSVAFRKEMISWKNVFSSVSENSKPYDKIDTARYLTSSPAFLSNPWPILPSIAEFNFFSMCDCSWLISFEQSVP